MTPSTSLAGGDETPPVKFSHRWAGWVAQTVEVGPGDVMRFVAGSRTCWTVADHIRKVYIAASA